MTSPIEISNRALSELGGRATVASFSEGSKEARACALWYDPLRKQLLRAAPWGFARKQFVLSELGNAQDNTSPYPWGFKYTYPSDALRVRYILPPGPNFNPATAIPGTQVAFCGLGPSRSNRFIIAQDIEPSLLNSRKVLLANLQYAHAVYVADETNTEMFEDDFAQALVSAMAAKMCMAITGNVNMRAGFIESAQMAITNARVTDGNEAIPTLDHTPDWMAARNDGWGPVSTFSAPMGVGDWNVGWSDMNWGM
jgi:hypothetical protein